MGPDVTNILSFDLIGPGFQRALCEKLGFGKKIFGFWDFRDFPILIVLQFRTLPLGGSAGAPLQRAL